MDMTEDKDDGKNRKNWYYNTVTGEPEYGPLSPMEKRMGPYRTREDAVDAWRIVQERNAKWDEQDRQWNRWEHSHGGGDTDK